MAKPIIKTKNARKNEPFIEPPIHPVIKTCQQGKPSMAITIAKMSVISTQNAPLVDVLGWSDGSGDGGGDRDGSGGKGRDRSGDRGRDRDGSGDKGGVKGAGQEDDCAV
jgi:hypothetical protein